MHTHYQSNPTEATMWLTTDATAEPDPQELDYVRARFCKKVLFAAPWAVVLTMFWGIAFENPTYLEEVPVVIEEVREQRQRGLQVSH